MGKTLAELFEEKFSENLSGKASVHDAFERTNAQMGFDAYSSYKSFATARKKRRAKK